MILIEESPIDNQENLRKWDLIIRPRSGWLALNLTDLWRYRDLIFLFVKRDLVVVYKQTILGPIWYFIQPLLSAAIFTVVFGRIARMPTDGLPNLLFYLSGLLCWNYFASCLISTADTFTANSSIFGKVYFPRLAIPISQTISNLAKMGIQTLLFGVIFCYYAFSGSNLQPTIWILALPLVVIQIAMLGLGFGILISSLTTKYRDLSMLLGFGVQLWMYASPVAYSVSQVPSQYRWIYELNPMVSIILSFRFMTMGSGNVSLETIGLSWLTTIIVLLSGLVLFNRVEKSFMDTI